MPNRQYFCWKVSLTFGCGCKEDTATHHVCDSFRTNCSSWVTYKTTNKSCSYHRRASGLDLKQQAAKDEDWTVVSEGPESSMSEGEMQDQMEGYGQSGVWEGQYLKKRRTA
ncbi:hypothetical protein B0T21DRAFT_349298 [Apiosordaria backusii]|uniref:Uncharacterized protein n=1 Tax=Apiosordaria backusii TaxID=314023 RepID=A0AA40BKJ2_9PEZI|nr:hypothetical protein B0T21DRAFT_349298 [Apiosordaria backusii]